MQNRTSFYQYLSGLATALIVALVSTWLLWKQLAFLPFVFILSWRVPIDIFFIYSIIWIAYVPHYFPRTYWWWSFVLVTISWYLLRLAGMEANQAILKTLLEATFSKDSERTRIARDLHDLLGHHLTALTINL